MSKRNCVRVCFVILMGLSSCSAFERKSEFKSVKLEGDTKLLYTNPAKSWTEGLPIGNGILGAMVLGGIEQERIAFNHCRLWRENKLKGLENPKVAHNLPLIRKKFFDNNLIEANDLANTLLGAQSFTGPDPFQPAGDLFIGFPDSTGFIEYQRELDMATGIVKIRYIQKGVRYLREVFASSTDSLIIVRLSADKHEALNCRINISRIEDPDCKITTWTTGNCVGYTGEFVEKVRFSASAKVLTKGGKLTVDSTTNPKIDVSNADEIVILISVATEKETDNSKNYCLRQLGKINTTKVFKEMAQTHIAEHQQLFSRVDLSFPGISKQNIPTDLRVSQFKNGEPDPGLVSLFFQYGRYLLISSSRSGGLPANLQGIWNEKLLPPWQADYHHDINIQMNYWPAEVCNLSECADPYLDYVESMIPSALTAAKNLYDCRGIFIPITGDPAAKCLKTETKWSEWTGAAAWLAHHFWLRWEYSGNQDFLRNKVYPLYKEVGLFYRDYLVPDPRKDSPHYGRLVTVPSYSPENAFAGGPKPVSLVVGATMDFELIYEVFTNLIKASEILGLDQEKRKEWQNILDSIPPLQVGKYGQLQEWLKDYEETKNPGHSSVSQQYALFSSGQITPERTPELAHASKISLERRLALNRPGGEGGWPGAVFSFCWARLNEGDRAYDILRNMIGNCKNGILFASGNSSNQIDQNYGLTADVAEMLLQSHNGEIKLLPALPSAWPSGHVRGLRARGGFEIEILWDNHRIKEAKVISVLGNKCRIRNSTPILIRSGNTIINTIKTEESVSEFDTNAGETYVIEFASGK